MSHMLLLGPAAPAALPFLLRLAVGPRIPARGSLLGFSSFAAGLSRSVDPDEGASCAEPTATTRSVPAAARRTGPAGCSRVVLAFPGKTELWITVPAGRSVIPVSHRTQPAGASPVRAPVRPRRGRTVRQIREHP